MIENTTQLPLSCAARDKCAATFYDQRAKAKSVDELKLQVEKCDVLLADAASELAMRSSTVEAEKLRDRLAACQRIEIALRQTLDIAEETGAILRQFLKDKGLDLEEAMAIVDEKIDKRRGALAEGLANG